MEIIVIGALTIVIIFLLKREFSRNFTEQTFLIIVNQTFRTLFTRIKWWYTELKKESHSKDKLK